MKTKILIAVILILFSWGTTINAQTYVSGLISANTNWTLSGSPYIVIGNTLVDVGITLTIDAGVTVKFDTLMALQINGELIAIGNSGNKITFTSNESTPAADDWGFILFSNSSTNAVYDVNGNYTSGSILEYCVIEYAGIGTYTFGAVMMDGALPFINYCTIQHNDASGIYASNLAGTLKITNNVISDNSTTTGGGIYIYNGGYVIISDNFISNNYALGGGSYGGGGIFTFSNTSEIFNNFISNNTATGYGAGGGGGGIYIRDGSSTIFKNIIRNNTLTNTVDGEGGGILIYGSTATISNNAITNNSAGSGGGIFGGNHVFNNSISDNTAKKGGGIYMSQNSIINNSIINNSAQNGSVIDIYIANNSDDFTYNTITGNRSTGSEPLYSIGISSLPLFNFNNIFSNTTTYELYNNNGSLLPNLDANNNWWGTSSDAQIQEKIYDWVDDASKGIVDYTPFSTSIRTDAPISPPAGLNIVASPAQLSLNWIANTESDIAGYKVYWGTSNEYPYANSIDVGNVTAYIINGLPAGTYFANVTAYDNEADTVSDDPNTIINETQCAGNESWYAKTFSSVGIYTLEQSVKNTFNLYPNPATYIVTLNVDNRNNADLTLNIYDIIGELVKSESLKQNQQQINIRDLSSGVYMVEIKSKEWTGKQKLIIQR